MTLPNDTDIDFFQGDTFARDFTALDFEDYSNVYFTVKENYKDLDSAAIVQISSASGLLVLNSGSVSESANASITIDSGSTVATVYIKPIVTREVEYSTNNYFYDLQMVKTDGTISTLEAGEFSTVRDVTKAIT